MQKQIDICVIGSGHAGFQVVKMLRANKFQGSIAIICQDDGDYYSKPALSTAFTKQLTKEKLIVQSSQQLADTMNCTLYTQTSVLEILPDAKQVIYQSNSSDNSHKLSFDKLIIATGAKPRKLPGIEVDNERIFSINHLQDYLTFSQKLKSGARVAIVGAGLVGSEYANDLVQAGYHVTLISRSSVVMSSLLPHNVAQAVTEHLSGLGVDLCLNTKVKHSSKEDNVLSLELGSGQSIEVDAVISSVGLIPNDDLAKQAGLDCEQGIIVNQFMQSSHSDIYALGDVANAQGLNLQYIMPINIGAKVIAKHITGTPEPLQYPAMPITIKTTKLPTVVAPPISVSDKSLRWQMEGSEENQMAVAYSGEQVVGFAVSGSYMKQRFPLMKQLPQWLPQ